MNSQSLGFRHFRLAVPLTLCLGLANVAWSAPSIELIEISPNPLITGQNFSLSVSGSPDVSDAIARVDFRTGEPRSLTIPLTRQGLTWIGSGLVPLDLRRELPGEAGAVVRVALFDAFHHRAEGVLQVSVHVESITAVFANGILTITGDNQDNVITASRDAAGRILVNAGAVPVIGGVATVGNTSLIRVPALAGNDLLSLNEVNGQMPAAELLGGDGDDVLIGGSSDDLLDGGPGNDILLGKGGSDQLFGGPGDDSLTGGSGVDSFFGGNGDDLSIWNPGDGSDVVEGEEGNDTMEFFGGNGTETVDIAGIGERLRFFRNPAGITMDCDGVEQVIFRAAGGNDDVTVNDLAGTQVRDVGIDLSGSQTNTIIIIGTQIKDLIAVSGSPDGVEVAGLAATVSVIGAEQSIDELIIKALAGADVVDASGVQPGVIDLTLNGGAGEDVLTGGAGDDSLFGDEDDDILNGGPGNDVLDGGPGDNVLIQ
jgi:Ca2+-binding RTX toxin-like protein